MRTKCSPAQPAVGNFRFRVLLPAAATEQKGKKDGGGPIGQGSTFRFMCGIPEFLRQRHRVGKRLVSLPVLTCAVSAPRSPFSGRTTCFEFNLPPSRLVFRLHGANANAIGAARTSGRHEQLLLCQRELTVEARAADAVTSQRHVIIVNG